MGYAVLLQNKINAKLNASEKKFLDRIFRGLEHINRLVNDLLYTTKISRIENPYEEINFNELIDTVKDRLEYKLNISHIELNVQEDLPRVICDRIKITEVLQNLITNAIKFSSGRVNIKSRIEINYCEQDTFYQFSIKDNGVGISPEHHTEIFKEFKRVTDDEGAKWRRSWVEHSSTYYR